LPVDFSDPTLDSVALQQLTSGYKLLHTTDVLIATAKAGKSADIAQKVFSNVFQVILM